MKNVFITICLLLSCISLMAQNNKKEKKLLKSLKKEYGLLYADYIKCRGDDFTYIYLKTKNGYLMIADSIGQLIIPTNYPSQENYTNIEYVPSHKRGYETKHMYGSVAGRFYIGNQGCFVAKDESGNYIFYNQKGTKLSEFTGFLHESYRTDAYLATFIPKTGNDYSNKLSANTNNKGLLAKDGTVLIPTVFSEIDAEDTGLCYVSQNENGIIKRGVINIANTAHVDVPCIFNKVVLSEKNNAWLVRMHELDTLSVYSPDSAYSCTYTDDGEQLYESGQYEEARKYYSIEHSNSLWANAYLGACGWKLAVSSFNKAEHALDELGKTTNSYGHDIANTVYNQLDLFEKESKIAIKYFDLYLQGEDERYKPRIKEIKYDLVKLMNESDILRKSVTRELEAYKYRRETYLEEERLEQIKTENERVRQQEQQRVSLEQQRINNQRLHEINERNRIALERQRAKRRAEEKRKTEQKRTENQNSSITNRNIPQNTKRWRNTSIPITIQRTSTQNSTQNAKDASVGKEHTK